MAMNIATRLQLTLDSDLIEEVEGGEKLRDDPGVIL